MLAQMGDRDVIFGFDNSVVGDYSMRACVERHLGELGRTDPSFIDSATMAKFNTAEVPIMVIGQRSGEAGADVLRLAATAMISDGNIHAQGPVNSYNYSVLGIAQYNEAGGIIRSQYEALDVLTKMEPMALSGNSNFIRQDFAVYEIECN
jgi:hypothetical protein